jgi:hypothetical protein
MAVGLAVSGGVVPGVKSPPKPRTETLSASQRVEAGLVGYWESWGKALGILLNHHSPFLIAAAFSIQMAQPRANVPQDSKGTGQSAQASERDFARSQQDLHRLLRDLGG